MEGADSDEEKNMMAVVDVEVDMAEVVGIIQLSGKVDQMQEWCSSMMSHRCKCTTPMISHQMSGTGYHRLVIS